MGLLRKAATGGGHFPVQAPADDESSHGGLLKTITEKQYKKTIPASHMEKVVMEKLYAGFAKFGVFQGVIIEALKYSAGEFAGRLSFMVSGFGAAQGLTPGRALVLFGSGQDGELIGRHLAKTVPGNNIFSFQAKTPQEAFDIIKPYL
jgi:hypothetical protein